MKYFVLTYDPSAELDPRVQEFEDDLEAFRVLEAETLQHLGSDGIEVVLFYCDSERTLRSANQRYFNPEVTRRLGESPQSLRGESERIANQLIGLVRSPSL